MNNKNKPRTKNSQENINHYLLKIYNDLKQHSDKAIIKNYVIGMFFIKYVSDLWNSRSKHYVDTYPNEAYLVTEMLKNERFVVPNSANFYTLHKQRFFSGNGERIDTAITELENKNPFKLIDGTFSIFKNISFNAIKLDGGVREKDALLQYLLEAFYTLELDVSSPQDSRNVGSLFNYLIQHFSSGSTNKSLDGSTPPSVASLMAKLISPQRGESICDPTCGCGTLLIQCAKEIQTQYGSKEYSLFGQETSDDLWSIAKLNLFFHEEDNHIIKWGDSLRQPHLLDYDDSLMTFDSVVCHPPFALENWGLEFLTNDPHNRFSLGSPPKNKGDYAFLLHALRTLKPATVDHPGGRLAIFLPHGVLFRGSSESEIRKQLVELGLLDTVIGLPEKLFTNAGLSGVIIIIKKQYLLPKKHSILFIDASRVLKSAKHGNYLSEDHINKIISTYKNRKTIENYSYLADIDDIRRNGYNLNIRRFVSVIEEEDHIDLDAVSKERNLLINQLEGIDSEMTQFLQELNIKK